MASLKYLMALGGVLAVAPLNTAVASPTNFGDLNLRVQAFDDSESIPGVHIHTNADGSESMSIPPTPGCPICTTRPVNGDGSIEIRANLDGTFSDEDGNVYTQTPNAPSGYVTDNDGRKWGPVSP